MKRFSISDIEILTGIKAHTLRIWEQRYSFFTPKRTETNIRYYNDEDLRLFLNVATLNENGYKISKISTMTNLQINELVNKLKEDHFNTGVQVQMLANATLRMDEREFETLLSGCVREMGLEKAMDEVIFPLMRKIGFMWQVGTITTAHEHFAVHHICNKITIATSKLKNIKSHEGKRYLLFLPEGELHEAGLLFAKYLLKESGQQVLYLGSNMPLDNLIDIIPFYEPDYILSVITQVRSDSDVNNTITKILESIPNTPLILVGAQITDRITKSHPDLTVLNNFEEFEKLINSNTVSLAS